MSDDEDAGLLSPEESAAMYADWCRQRPVSVADLNDALLRGTRTRDDVRYVAGCERDMAQAVVDDLVATRETKGLLASEQRQLSKARDRAFEFAQLLDDLEPVHVLTPFDRWGPF